MQDVGEVILEEMGQLAADLESARLFGLSNQRQRVLHNIMPEGFQHITEAPKERLVLPTLVATMSDRTVRLEFTPAADPEAWWANAFCSVQASSFCFKITRREVLAWFSRSQNTAFWDEFRVDNAEYDDKFFFFGTNVKKTKQILQVDQRLEKLCSFANLEHIAFDERFARLTCLVRPDAKISADAIRRTLDSWVALVIDMETWTANDTVAPK